LLLNVVEQRGPTKFDLRAISQKRENLLATSKKMLCKTTDSQYLKLKKGRKVNASLKLLHNNHLLQISISGMPTAQPAQNFGRGQMF